MTEISNRVAPTPRVADEAVNDEGDRPLNLRSPTDLSGTV
jgi:hypothetical protein